MKLSLEHLSIINDYTFYIVYEQYKFDIPKDKLGIFVLVTIDKQSFHIRFYNLQNLMKYIFQVRYDNVNIFNLYKKYMFYKKDFNINVINNLRKTIKNNILSVNITLLNQNKTIMKHNSFDCINIVSNNNISEINNIIYLYSNNIIHFKMKYTTYLQIVKLHYSNQKDKIKSLLDNDNYFQQECTYCKDINITSLYNDLIHNFEDVYFQ